jgi:transposase
MAARALGRTGERHLVLDYLLGYPMRHITATYGVTRQTAYRILARHEVSTARKATP